MMTFNSKPTSVTYVVGRQFAASNCEIKRFKLVVGIARSKKVDIVLSCCLV